MISRFGTRLVGISNKHTVCHVKFACLCGMLKPAIINQTMMMMITIGMVYYVRLFEDISKDDETKSVFYLVCFFMCVCFNCF